MAYDQKLATRIRAALAHLPHVTEQEKMGGISFMVAGRMCVRAHSGNDLMLRCEPELTDELLTRPGARRFTMKGRPKMNGWLLVGPEGTKAKKDFDYWISLALAFNSKAKKAKPRTGKLSA